jgi:SGF29 tudor-like domain
MASRGATASAPPALSASGVAVRMSRVKADADFYSALDYDRARYSDDVAHAACVFLVAIRNGLTSDPFDPDALVARLTPPAEEPAPRGTKRPAASLAGRNTSTAATGTTGVTAVTSGASAPKQKKAKRSHAAGAGNSGPNIGASIGGAGAGANGDSRDRSGAGTGNGGGARRNANGNTPSSTTNGTTNNNRNGSGPGLSSSGNGAPAGANGTTHRTSNGTSNGNGNGNGGGGGGNTSIQPGCEVACRVKEDGKTTWILAKVVRYVSESKKYQVADSGDEDGRKVHMVFKKYIRVIPKLGTNHSSPDRMGIKVMAVYPDTTVFYPALVCGAPSAERYKVMFDDEDPGVGPKFVSARYVIDV